MSTGKIHKVGEKTMQPITFTAEQAAKIANGTKTQHRVLVKEGEELRMFADNGKGSWSPNFDGKDFGHKAVVTHTMQKNGLPWYRTKYEVGDTFAVKVNGRIIDYCASCNNLVGEECDFFGDVKPLRPTLTEIKRDKNEWVLEFSLKEAK